MTEVVAALIWQGERFLVCQRPAHKARGLMWEFVGGKVEQGESLQDALIRECREELAVTVEPGSVFMELTHTYPDLTVHLTLFNAVISDGVLQRLEHNDIRWITPQEIDEYDFCPADEEILQRLKCLENNIQAELFSMADESYKHFQGSLMPTVNPEKVLGVRMPQLRKLARQIKMRGEHLAFYDRLPHKYYEEDNIHGILLSEIRDFQSVVDALDRFLPYIDNWATCDLIVPKAFNSCPEGLLDKVNQWLSSGHVYTVRFAIGVLMRFYLDKTFQPKLLQLVVSVISEEYYVNMMLAWYFTTALAKQYDSTVPLLEQGVLPRWVHNKTIQKAIESYRIADEKKQYLKTLRIK